MRYVLCGVGRQGLAAAYDLVKHCEARQVLAVDSRFESTDSLSQTQRVLDSLLGPDAKRVDLQPGHLDQPDTLRKLVEDIRQADCLVSALPWKCNSLLTEIAIEAGTPMCDMGGNPDMVEQQKKLADEHKHPIVPECGLAPGISNVFMKHLWQQHRADPIRIFCGGLPIPQPDRSTNPLQYKLLFSAGGLISEYMGPCPLLKDGKVEYAPALSGLETFDDQYEAFCTSNHSPRIFEYLAELGVKNASYKTLRYHGHWERFNVLISLGFLSSSTLQDPELARRLEESSPLHFDRSRDTDQVILAALGTTRSGQTVQIMLNEPMTAGEPFTAMEKTTSWGTTIVAHAMASGLARPSGFSTPEQFLDTKWFISQLQKRTKYLSVIAD